jgi:hypothetical protein
MTTLEDYARGNLSSKSLRDLNEGLFMATRLYLNPRTIDGLPDFSTQYFKGAIIHIFLSNLSLCGLELDRPWVSLDMLKAILSEQIKDEYSAQLIELNRMLGDCRIKVNNLDKALISKSKECDDLIKKNSILQYKVKAFPEHEKFEYSFEDFLLALNGFVVRHKWAFILIALLVVVLLGSTHHP